MAAMMLVTMAILVRYSLALTQTELSQFAARSHTEKNSGVQGTVTITTQGNMHRLVANGIPDHDTGTFPGTGNPNSIQQQNIDVLFPSNPVVASQPTCLPKGAIAYTTSGVAMYNPYNSNNENAVEGLTKETFDLCHGHPDGRGSYHYHQTPKCVSDGSNDQFIGVAMDGFPIYGSKDSAGKTLVSADLDVCHGRLENGNYRYRLTADFPYIMACFKGTPNIAQGMLNDKDCTIISSGTTSSPGGATTPTPAMSTPSPNGMSMPPPNGMSTPPPKGMSTPPPKGMSTPPPNGMLNPPANGMSTPATSPGGKVPTTVGGTSAGTRTAPVLSLMFMILCLSVFMG